MATPEDIALDLEGHSPELTVIAGGLAVERSVQITPNITDMPEDDFKEYVHRVVGRADELEALSDIDRAISASTAQLNIEIGGLTMKLHELYDKKRWVHGYIKDRKAAENQQ